MTTKEDEVTACQKSKCSSKLVAQISTKISKYKYRATNYRQRKDSIQPC